MTLFETPIVSEMKTKLINSLLIAVGFLIISVCCLFLGHAWSEMELNTIASDIRKEPVFGTQALVLLFGVFPFFAAAVSYMGVGLIKQSFLPGLDARVALRKGQAVEVVATYTDQTARLRFAPFEPNSRTMLVRFKNYQALIPGFRYFFDGNDLKNVLPEKS